MPQTQSGSYPGMQSRTGAVDMTDRYVLFLALVLAGYAMLGRGFAYTGHSPIFIGEITLALGLAALVWSGSTVAVLANPLVLLLLLLFGWVYARTIPYLKPYGIDAIRDSMIVGYSLYALVTAGLLIEKPWRIQRLITYYRRFAVIYALIAPPLFVANDFLKDTIPRWPGTDVAILGVRDGDIAVHLCGVTLFSLLGFVRLPLISAIALFIGLVIVGSQTRGGLLAALLPVAVALVLMPRMKQLPRIAGIGVATLLIGALLGVSIVLPVTASIRTISIDQLLLNFGSIFIRGLDPGLDSTRIWREQWWDAIMAYTLHGPYFWTGKGFGINLANSDGFQVLSVFDGPLLRSPHNSHLTMLARAGVPGVLLWATVNLSWAGTMLWRYWQSRSRGQEAWSRLFVFLCCYWFAFVIDASFDVALEGPMLGIWFWTVIGIGIGAAMIYGYENRRRASPAFGARRPP